MQIQDNIQIKYNHFTNKMHDNFILIFNQCMFLIFSFKMILSCILKLSNVKKKYS